MLADCGDNPGAEFDEAAAMSLTPEQSTAVQSTEGPVLIIAAFDAQAGGPYLWRGARAVVPGSWETPDPSRPMWQPKGL